MMQNLPPGVTEHELLDAIENAVRVLAPKFSFGVFDVEDIAQEGRLECLRVLARYDPQPDETGRPTRPLANFFYTCVHNYYVRLKRDKLHRTDAPCPACRDGVPHDRTQKCDVHDRWRRRNERKACLMRTTSQEVPDQADARDGADVQATAEVNEVLALIDEHLPLDLRATYLQMRAGVANIPKHKRAAVEKAVRDILG